MKVHGTWPKTCESGDSISYLLPHFLRLESFSQLSALLNGEQYANGGSGDATALLTDVNNGFYCVFYGCYVKI